MRRGSIVRITIYGVLAGIFASLVAVLVPWLPTSASEQMDRIEFTFWFTTVICIGVVGREIQVRFEGRRS